MANPSRHIHPLSASKDAPGPRRATRREQRSDAAIPLTVCGFRADGRVFFELCSTRNVSHSGCCIHLRTRPQRDTALALRVIPEDHSTTGDVPQLLFEVVWLEPDEGGWTVGAVALGDANLYHLAFPSRTS